MAKKISSNDLFEGDVFASIKQSAEETIAKLQAMNSELIEMAKLTKSGIKGAKTDSSKGIQEFNKFTNEANQLQREKIELEKQEASLRKMVAQAENEELKTKKALNAEAEKEAKAKEKALKAQKDQESAYKQLAANTRDLKNQSKELAAQMLVLENAGKKNSKEYRQLASEYKNVTAAAQKGDQALKKIDSTVGDNFRNVGNYNGAINKLRSGLGELGLAFGIGSVVTSAGQTIVEFDQKIADLVAITGASGKDLEFFKAQAAELGKSVQGGASEVIEAYKLIGSAKPELLANAEALDSVTQSAITLSQASGMTLPEAATALTDAMNQFGAPAEEAARFIDSLANGALFGSAEIPQVTEALLKFGAVANTANVSLEESTGLIEALAEKGLKGAEAGTALRNVMLKLSAPDALPKEAKDRLEALGISMADLSDTSKPFSKRLDALKPLLKDNAALVKVFGTENAVAATNLINNTGRIEELTAQMHTQGTASKQAEDRTKTLSFAFNELKESWNALILQLSSGEGTSRMLVEGLSFIAQNLGTIVGYVMKAVGAWLIYQTTLKTVQAYNFIASGGLKDMASKMMDVWKSGKKAGAGVKEMGDGIKDAGKSMTSIPWVAIIGAVIELAMAFYDVASGAARAREQQERLEKYKSRATDDSLKNITKETDALDKQLKQRERDLQLALAKAKTDKERERIENEFAKLRQSDVKNTKDQVRQYRDAAAERLRQYRKEKEELKTLSEIRYGDRTAQQQERINELISATGTTSWTAGERLADAYDIMNAKIQAAGARVTEYNKAIEAVDETLKDYNNEVEINSVAHEDNTDKINAKIPKIKEQAKSMKNANDQIERTISLMQETQALTDEIGLYEAGENISSAVQAQLDGIAQSGQYSVSLIDQLIEREYELRKAILERQYLESIESATNQQEVLNAQAHYNHEVDKLDKEYKEKKETIYKDLETAQEDYAAKTLETEKGITDKTAEELKKQLEDRNKWASVVADYFIEQSNRKIAQIDKEKAAAESQFDYYKQLAAQGNIDAKESLAEQQRIIDEANMKKERELKRQQRIKLAEAVYSTYNAKVASGSENPLLETIKDATLLQQFIQSLPTFYDGTEDTGKNGNGVDGKGGFHAILHPNERVIPKSLNDQIGSMSNEALAKLAMEYQNGKVLRSDSQLGSAYETAILAGKIDELNNTIRNKPETNIELGEITQSVMNIVKSSKQGNTVVYNRYRIRS